jgi:type III restriction enzyme
VVGRALRRQSYDLNDEQKFDVEYADILGIPFDFTAKPVVAPPKKPKKVTRVHAVKARETLAISFPRVTGYRKDLADEQITAEFTADSRLLITPEMVGPCRADARHSAVTSIRSRANVRTSEGRAWSKSGSASPTTSGSTF